MRKRRVLRSEVIEAAGGWGLGFQPWEKALPLEVHRAGDRVCCVGSGGGRRYVGRIQGFTRSRRMVRMARYWFRGEVVEMVGGSGLLFMAWERKLQIADGACASVRGVVMLFWGVYVGTRVLSVPRRCWSLRRRIQVLLLEVAEPGVLDLNGWTLLKLKVRIK